MGCSKSDDIFVMEPSDGVKFILKQRNTTLAINGLVDHLKTHTGCAQPYVAPSLVTAIMTGDLVYDPTQRPTGFSVFSVGPRSPDTLISQRLLVKGTLCDDVDEEQLNFLVSGKMIVPSDAHDLIRQLKIWREVLAFLWDRGNASFVCIMSIHASLSRLEDTLNDRKGCDPKFFLRVLYYVDTVTQDFVGECRGASDASVLPFQSLDSASIVRHVRLGTLHITLPSWVTSAQKNKQQPDQSPSGPPTKKKKEKEMEVAIIKATTSNSKSSWRLPEGVNYTTVFPPNSWDEVPKHRLPDGKMQEICLVLHANGKCGRKKCKKHHGRLPPSEETEFDSFITDKFAAVSI